MGHTEADVWYRIRLTVRDSGGLTTTVFRDVQPRTVQLTFATSPAGLSLRLDGQPRTTPLTVTGVVGVQRTLEAPSPQTVGNKIYVFVRWSDGGGSSHTISTPASSTTYTATFQKQRGRPLVVAANAGSFRGTSGVLQRLDVPTGQVAGAQAVELAASDQLARSPRTS